MNAQVKSAEQALHEDVGTGYVFDDELSVEAATALGIIHKHALGPYVVRFGGGSAHAQDLRAVAAELDRLNGINGVPQKGGYDYATGTYSIVGLDRTELLAITQLVGLAGMTEERKAEYSGSPKGTTLGKCLAALGDDGSMDSFTRLFEECQATFPDFEVKAEF